MKGSSNASLFLAPGSWKHFLDLFGPKQLLRGGMTCDMQNTEHRQTRGEVVVREGGKEALHYWWPGSTSPQVPGEESADNQLLACANLLPCGPSKHLAGTIPT